MRHVDTDWSAQVVSTTWDNFLSFSFVCRQLWKNTIIGKYNHNYFKLLRNVVHTLNGVKPVLVVIDRPSAPPFSKVWLTFFFTKLKNPSYRSLTRNSFLKKSILIYFSYLTLVNQPSCWMVYIQIVTWAYSSNRYKWGWTNQPEYLHQQISQKRHDQPYGLKNFSELLNSRAFSPISN